MWLWFAKSSQGASMLSLSTAESQAASIPNQVGRSLQSHREEHPMLCTGITTTTRQPAFYILA